MKNNTYYDDLIKKRIGEALRKQSKKESLDLETLEKWVRDDKERRRPINRVKRLVRRIKEVFLNDRN